MLMVVFFYKTNIIRQMLVIGSLLQISAFFAESRQLPFSLFVISFFFGGTGMVFQVGVIYFIYTEGISTDRSRMHVRMASLRLFRRTLNTK
jgi:hypothetical protein